MWPQRKYVVCLSVIYVVNIVSSRRQLVKIAGYFEDAHQGDRLAFEHGVDHVNFGGHFPDILIQHIVETIPKDSLETHKRVCRDVREGVAAVVGPYTSGLRGHVESVCTSLHVPHILVNWDPRDIHPHFSVNLYPEHQTLSRAYGDYVAYQNWTNLVVLYDSDEGLVRLQEVLLKNKGYQITFRRLDKDENKIIEMFEELKEIMGDANRYIVDCNVSEVYTVLKKAQEVNMLSETFHYFFTTLDLSLVHLDEFKHSGANITAFRLLDSGNSILQKVTQAWMNDELNKLPSPLQGKWNISVLHHYIKKY